MYSTSFACIRYYSETHTGCACNCLLFIEALITTRADDNPIIFQRK